MRAYLARNPQAIDVRMALAEHYRERGVPAEAARWGILTSGWATEREIRDLRRWLLGRYGDFDYVRELLGLAVSDELPAEVRDLVAPEYRAAVPVEHASSPTARAWRAAGCLGAVVVLTAIVSTITFVGRVFLVALLDSPGLRETAWDAVFATAAGLALTAVVVVPWWIRSRIMSGNRSSSPHSSDLRPAATWTPYSVELAWEVFERGDERSADILLRACLRWGGTAHETAVRAALAEMARRHGRAAEAGRWGSGVLGLTTPAERSAFAAGLVAERDPRWRLRQLAEFGPTQRLNEDALDVLRRASASTSMNVDSESAADDAALDAVERRESRAVRAGLAMFVILAVGSAGIVVAAVTSWFDPTIAARIVIALAAAPLVVMMVDDVAGDVRARRRRREGAPPPNAQ